MIAEAEMEVGDQIQMERNSVCGVWLDLVELVRSQDILIVNNEDDDLTDPFLTGMDAYKKELMSKTGRLTWPASALDGSWAPLEKTPTSR